MEKKLKVSFGFPEKKSCLNFFFLLRLLRYPQTFLLVGQPSKILGGLWHRSDKEMSRDAAQCRPSRTQE
jgi:hypothetical protein